MGATDKLIALAEKVGGEAWPALLQYTIARAWTETIASVLISIMLVLAIRYTLKATAQNQDDMDKWMPRILVLLVAGLGVAFSISILSVSVASLIAPAGATLRKLIP